MNMWRSNEIRFVKDDSAGIRAASSPSALSTQPSLCKRSTSHEAFTLDHLSNPKSGFVPVVFESPVEQVRTAHE